jgi:hypothetical protein
MIHELAKDCRKNINGLDTKAYLNIIPLGPYDCLISIHSLEKHHVVLDL